MESKGSEEILAALADKTSVEFNAVPLFVPMQHPDDLVFEKILRLMKERPSIRGSYSVDETMSILNTNLVIALHSLIYAVNMGCPWSGLPTNQK